MDHLQIQWPSAANLLGACSIHVRNMVPLFGINVVMEHSMSSQKVMIAHFPRHLLTASLTPGSSNLQPHSGASSATPFDPLTAHFRSCLLRLVRTTVSDDFSCYPLADGASSEARRVFPQVWGTPLLATTGMTSSASSHGTDPLKLPCRATHRLLDILLTSHTTNCCAASDTLFDLV